MTRRRPRIGKRTMRTLTALLRRSWSCHLSQPPLPLPLFSPTDCAFSLPTHSSSSALIFSLTFGRCTVLGRYAIHAHFQPVVHRTTISIHHVVRPVQEARRVRHPAHDRRYYRRNRGGACSSYSPRVLSFIHSLLCCLLSRCISPAVSVTSARAAMLPAARCHQSLYAALKVWTCPRVSLSSHTVPLLATLDARCTSPCPYVPPSEMTVHVSNAHAFRPSCL